MTTAASRRRPSEGTINLVPLGSPNDKSDRDTSLWRIAPSLWRQPRVRIAIILLLCVCGVMMKFVSVDVHLRARDHTDILSRPPAKAVPSPTVGIAARLNEQLGGHAPITTDSKKAKKNAPDRAAAQDDTTENSDADDISDEELVDGDTNNDDDNDDSDDGSNNDDDSTSDASLTTIASGTLGDDQDPFDAPNSNGGAAAGAASAAAVATIAGGSDADNDITDSEDDDAAEPLTPEEVERDTAEVPTTEAALASWIRQHTADDTEKDHDDQRPHKETTMFGGEEASGDVLTRGKLPPFIVIAYNYGRKRSIGGMQQRFEQFVYGLAHMGAQLHCVSTRKPVMNEVTKHLKSLGCTVHFGTSDQQVDQVREEIAALPANTPIFAVSHFVRVSIEAVMAFTKNRGRFRRNTGGVDDHMRMVTRFRRSFPPTTKYIAVTDDVHHIRVGFVLRSTSRLSAKQIQYAVATTRRHELRFYASMDGVMTVSNEDLVLLRRLTSSFAADKDNRRNGGAAAEKRRAPLLFSVPYIETWAIPQFNAIAPVTARKGLFYLGTAHALGLVSVTWYLKEVHPLLHAKLNELMSPEESRERGKLVIAGNYWGQHATKKNTMLGKLIAKYRQAGTLTVATDIPDRRVEMLFNSSRVFIAPLLNATGVATKCIHALSQGLPVVTTVAGVQGIWLPPYHNGSQSMADIVSVVPFITHGDGSSGPDAHAFALAIRRLILEDMRWSSLARNALTHARRHLSFAALRRSLKRGFESVAGIGGPVPRRGKKGKKDKRNS